MKQLAEETQTAMSEIESSLARVHDRVDATVDGIHATGDRVDETRTAVDRVADELDTVVEQVQAVDNEVQEIETATETQAESTQRVSSAVEAVDEIGAETAADASVAAEATREQTTELAEVSTQVATLSERAATLSAGLDQYDTTGESPPSGATGEETAHVTFWHAMSGETALTLESFAREFESTTTGVEIELVSKGNYRATFDATLRAAARGEPPALAQLFEIGTTRARKSGAFRPAGELLSSSHVDSLLDPAVNYYRYGGRLHSIPFNVSNPVLAYDTDAFAAAGLDPERPPATFAEVERAARQLVTEGPTEYGITFANYSWFVEQWFAQADEPLVEPANGREGPATTANTGELAHDLFNWWVEMEADGLYHNPAQRPEVRPASRSTTGRR